MEWAVKTQRGPCRVNHAAVVVGDIIFSFGGYTSNENYFDRSIPIEIFCFHTRTLKWTTLKFDTKAAPFKRYGHSAVAYGTKVYLWGGRNDNHCDGTLYCFDTEILKWSQPTVTGHSPNASDGHAACVHRDVMFVHGGYVESESQFTLSLHALNLTTLNWLEYPLKGDYPLYRDFHTMSVFPNSDFLVVFGGREMENSFYEGSENESYPNTLHFYDLNQMFWYRPSSPAISPVGRRSHSSFVYQNNYYIFGGFNSVKQCHLNDLQSYDKERNVWVKHCFIGVCPSPRRRQALCVHNSQVYMFGGTHPHPEPQKIVTRHIPNDDLDNTDEKEALQELDDLWILNLEPNLKSLCLMRCVSLGLDLTSLPHMLQQQALLVPRSSGADRAGNSPSERG